MRLRRSLLILLPVLAVASVPFAISSCTGDDTLLNNTGGPDATTDHANGDASSPVKIQILGINDFHGNLDPPVGSGGIVPAAPNDPEIGPDAGAKPRDGGAINDVPAGGAAYLAAHIAKLKAANPNTAIVSSGDLTGASPLVSALFHDEPAIHVMNAIGLDFNGVGNHEFDHGVPELRRLQYGGCHPDECADGAADYPGARFQYLAANVDVAKDKTVFSPYAIKSFGSVKVAFIGMTLKDTPSVTIPSAVAGLTFDDEVATVNGLLPEIKKENVSAIVVLLHQGNIPTDGTTYDGCGIDSGVIADIATKLDPAIDVVLSAHSHQPYNCSIGGKLVTSAASFGRVVTQIELTVDPVQHKVTAKTAKNHAVTRDIAPDPTVQGIVAKYTELAAPRANKVIGHITAPLTRVQSGESVLGDVIADAMLAAAQKPGLLAKVAFMNPGGIRSDISCASNDCSASKPSPVTYAQAFTSQPFGNYLVTMTLTGAQIRDLLQQQFNVTPARFLQISGMKYTYSGTTVDVSSIQIGGQPMALDQSYRVVTNNFLASGTGDGFTVFKQGTEVTNAGPDGTIVDIDALTAYLTAHDPLATPALDRIVKR
ncbi:bifunctional metallophosphatase/5'-nucleotidase [Pendulispora brunnea]|uniref:Bifunctional metallophosphatase/5'-nucleotidase n=1 Tax=Pendulispora brunnea TaxID=2905690 RepID=A0ABZ2KU72_9BACT